MDPDACLIEIEKHLNQIGGEYDRCLELIEALGDWLAKDGAEPAEIETVLSWHDVVIGAYWFCVHYHSGQWSDEYRIQCILSQIYKPGPWCDGPEEESTEMMVYDSLVELAGFSDGE